MDDKFKFKSQISIKLTNKDGILVDKRKIDDIKIDKIDNKILSLILNTLTEKLMEEINNER